MVVSVGDLLFHVGGLFLVGAILRRHEILHEGRWLVWRCAPFVLEGVGLFAGINEIGRFTNARRRKVLVLKFFLRGPHAAAEVTRRGEIHHAV